MKKTLGQTVGIVIVAFIVAAGIFPDTFRHLVDVVSFPWAYSFLGKPTLTGNWRGQVSFEGRPSREIKLEIERMTLDTLRVERNTKNSALNVVNDHYSMHGSFAGTAEMPDELGDPIHYELSGSANRSGSEVVIKLRAVDRKFASQVQPLLQELTGSWKGKTLELNGQFSIVFFDRDGAMLDLGQPTQLASAQLTRQ
ncbi:MAG: hypothetical protein JST85_14295 [Acidobacteria bacterium]|nr:hypothetical protein [Acidobacteriota bacterium]